MSKLFPLIATALTVFPVMALARQAPTQLMAPHPLLERAQQTPQIGPEYAFHVSYQDNTVSAQAFVDPSKPRGKRLYVTSPPEEQWSNDFKDMMAEFDAAPLDEFWCTDFLALIGPDVRPVQETPDGLVFAFSPQPGPNDDEEDRKFLSGMIGHLTLSRPNGRIKNFQLKSRKPFKPIFIAKIKSFHMEAQCQASPDGRPYIARLETKFSGKIALKNIEEHETRVISNLTLPRKNTRHTSPN